MVGPNQHVDRRGALRLEFLEHIAVWYVYINSVVMLYGVLANWSAVLFEECGIRRGLFAIPAILPMSIFAVYMGIRIHRDAALRRKHIAWLFLCLLAVGVPVAIVLFHRPFEIEPDLLIWLFEGGTACWFAAFMIHSAVTRGRWGLLTFFGVTLLYGMILENTGIVMRYFFEPGWHVYLGRLPAPLCTMMGWPIIFYVMFSITERFASWWPWLRARAWARAMTVTVLALCFDAQMDPIASLGGTFWRWNDALPPAFLGVPALNFVAWVGALLPFSWLLFRLLDRDDLTPAELAYELLLRVWPACVLGGLLCFAVMAVLEGGIDGPTCRILSDFLSRLLPY